MFIRKVSIEDGMDDIAGQVITDIRHLTGDSPAGLTWTVNVSEELVVLELGDGSLLIPVNDAEGNAPGVFQEKGIEDWNDIIGSLIEDMAPMSHAAMEYRDWDASSSHRPPVLSLNTGEQLYPTADPEGNHPGILFRVQNGETFRIDFEPVNN